MSRSKLFGIIAIVLATALSAAAQAQPISVQSPNGVMEISIATLRSGSPNVAGGQLSYQITFRGQTVVDWSNLGLILEGGSVLGPAMRVESSQPSSQDETWTPVAGKASPIRNHYNALTVEAVETGGNSLRLTVEARAYDDGVAFRYLVPEQPSLSEVRILNEATNLRFSKDADTFPYIARGFQTSNEDNYHELPLGGLHPEYLINLPFVLHLPGIAWVGITEADLEDYPNLFLTGTVARTVNARLATRVEDVHTWTEIAPSFDPKADAAKPSVIARTPVKSGWRVFMIGDQPGRLVESNMVVNLNPPCAIGDPGWVKPGKIPWDWWNGSQAKGVANPGKNNATIKYYIDFAARNNFPYMLIDAGWAVTLPARPGYHPPPDDLTKVIPELDIPMLVEYAKSKNVRLWLWAHYRDVNDQIDTAFPLFEKWGIAGVKVDFMDRTDQWMVNWYRMVARKAAEHHLMVDFHGAFKPDGMRRTFPNVLTREGVLGAEYNKWSGRVTPQHNVMLAFTRMLAGPMDYTPGGFDNVTWENFVPRNILPMVMGTRAHATALYVVFEGELQMISDSPDAYDGQKELNFLRVVPTTWDETRVVSGEPPKYIAVARRSGNEWFFGAITNWDPREFDLPLTFLRRGNYTAEIYSDGPNAATEPKDSVLETRSVNAQTVLKLKLAPGGGCAIHFAPAQH
jgi:alpha-glucosidase